MTELLYANPVCNFTRECAEGSNKMYLEDPEKRAKFDDMVNALYHEHKDKDVKQLTRDEVLESVDRIENKKF